MKVVMANMKVLFVTNVPSPYRVDFFNELGKMCDLTVVFEKKTSDERDKSWSEYSFSNFNGIFVKGKSINTDTAICIGILKYLNKNEYDHIVVTNISSPTGILAIIFMRLRKMQYWIEGDGGVPKKGQFFKRQIKTYLISGAKGCFSTSKAHDKYYLAYGADSSSIFRYPFTSISRADIENSNIVRKCSKTSLKKKLNMMESKIILSVGRFSYNAGYGKGFDLIMKVAESVGNDYGFYIVGDKPTEEFLTWKQNKGLDNVHFVSYLNKQDLAEYYAAADCFVLLSRGEAWGLVINEAMVYSLPIVSTPYTVAATELITDGVNGYIVPTDNIELISSKIMICVDTKKNELFGARNKEIISGYTIEDMAKRHIDVFLDSSTNSGIIA